VFNVDYIVMSQVLGPHSIASYSVLMMAVQASIGLFTTILSVDEAFKVGRALNERVAPDLSGHKG